MKMTIRNNVFETNSSSTHTLTLVSNADYEADKQTAKPKYRNYGVAATKYDKLLMACGCCKELFENEQDLARNGNTANFPSPYEAAMSNIVRVYCELTGEDYGKTYARLDETNRSGRACHMKFFNEGALDDAEYDYMVIYDLFDDDEDTSAKIRRYFDDKFVLCYREYYGGVCWDDDDDE